MGWRFRKSFKIIPGVRLNLSKSGFSASIGGAPLTLNVGPHGVFGTASLPGTGMQFRQHLSTSPSTSAPQSLPSFIAPEPPSTAPLGPPSNQSQATPSPIQEIRSASTELLTSESLRELKRILQTAFEERVDIEGQLSAARIEGTTASERYFSWDNGFLLKRLFEGAFQRRKELFEMTSARTQELEEQLRLTTVATQIDIAREQAEPYFRMRDEFAVMAECAAIWDVKSRQATDRYRERTTATVRISRSRVHFSLGWSDIIQWDQKVPHFENINGGDLFLYPGFILYRSARTAFSVLDYHDVNGKLDLVQFQEEEGVPTDAKVVGTTWAKANKDGSPDRRFANNYQIPVVAYVALTLKSETGLWEEFQFSNAERPVRFIKAFNEFVQSFPSPSAKAN